MNWLKKIFVPTRTDGYVLCLMAIWAAAILTSTAIINAWLPVGTKLAVYFVPFLTMYLSFAVFVGNRESKDILRILPFCLLVMGSAITLVWRMDAAQLWPKFYLELFAHSYTEIENGGDLFRHSMYVTTVFLFLVFVTAIVSLLFEQLGEIDRKRRSSWRLVVVGLLTVGLIGLAIARINSEISQSLGQANGPTVAAITWLGVTVLGLTYLLPSLLCSKMVHRLSAQLLSLLTFLFLSAFFWIGFPATMAPAGLSLENMLAAILLSWAGYQLVALSLCKPAPLADKQMQKGIDSSMVQVHPRAQTHTGVPIPSFWAFSPILLLLLGFAVSSAWVKPSVATMTEDGSLVDFPSVVISRLNAQPGIRAKEGDQTGPFGAPKVTGGGQTIFLSIEFDESVKPDVFSTTLNELLSDHQLALELHKMPPHVDTSILKGHVTSAEFIGCDLNRQQVVNLLSVNGAYQFIECTFDREPPTMGMRSEMAIFESAAGEVDNILSWFVPDDIQGALSISGPLSEADWNAIIFVAGNAAVQVYLQDEIPANALQGILSNPMVQKNLEVTLGQPTPGLAPPVAGGVMQLNQVPKSAWKLIMDSNCAIGLDPLSTFNKVPEYWAAYFVGANTYTSNPSIEYLSYGPHEEEVRSYFEFDAAQENGEKKQGLWLPCNVLGIERFATPIGEVSPPEEIHLLSFDEQWGPNEVTSFTELVGDCPTIKMVRQLQLGGRLAKLERLYLPTTQPMREFGFLKDLPKLKLFQFDASYMDVPGEYPDLDPTLVPQLEEVRMHGTPVPKLLKQLKQVASLKRIVIVDAKNEFTAQRRKLTRRFLGSDIELIVVQPGADQAKPPKEFMEHLDQVRQNIRAKYLE